MLKKLFFLFLFIGTTYAGDKADFVTIGWSQDYNYYAFAQYGEQDGSGFPYAEMYFVDVAKNEFVSDGVFQETWEDVDDPAAIGLNVLFALLNQSDSLRNSLGIEFNRVGQIVFMSSQAFVDTARFHIQDDEMEIICCQRQEGSVDEFNVRAAFDLQIHKNGQFIRRIGNPNRWRQYVIRYGIDQVISNENGSAIIVVMREEELGFEGASIRYMVETFRKDS